MIKYHCMFCNTDYIELPEGAICPKCGFPMNRDPARFVVENKGAILVKIGSPDALNNMRQGNFWMQSPASFQTHFDNEARDDVYESAFDYIEMDKDSPDGIAYSSFFTDQNKYRILCFGIIRVNDGLIERPDERIKLFGTHFSYVSSQRLAQAFSEAATERNAHCQIGGINYISDSYKGIYTPFCKLPKFSYQVEHRIVFCSEAYLAWDACQRDEISIGDISSWFSKPIPIEELFAGYTFDELKEVIID